ncbi:hypothetical protein CHLV4142_03615 [Campylobacter helveticus]|uniref:Periplasmic protein n=1 Tax=Campylobacter helveticus TaxID=28898 RepID=A0ABY3L2C1_9BACT|nr:hypothetical protein [Campylobacter helveticus]MCR2039231.1 hypothetical protein [Campylobacter helveticus]MCR2061729.1 hypothetical protein [Campylobacter helveticus]TXK57562.1 hypothetical protein FVD16_04895 [Campylobacter helveticus]
MGLKDSVLRLSVACSIALMPLHLNADYLKFDKDLTHIKEKKNNNFEQFYKNLCERIYIDTKFNFLTLAHNQKLIKDENEAEKIKKQIKVLDKVIDTAQKRINNKKQEIFIKDNEKVFYACVALKNILNEMLDEDFMKIVGKMSKEELNNIDIVKYAKGVLKAQMDSQNV